MKTGRTSTTTLCSSRRHTLQSYFSCSTLYFQTTSCCRYSSLSSYTTLMQKRRSESISNELLTAACKNLFEVGVFDTRMILLKLSFLDKRSGSIIGVETCLSGPVTTGSSRSSMIMTRSHQAQPNPLFFICYKYLFCNVAPSQSVLRTNCCVIVALVWPLRCSW